MKLKQTLLKAAQMLDLNLEGNVVFGYNNKSLGAKVRNESGENYWLKVTRLTTARPAADLTNLDSYPWKAKIIKKSQLDIAGEKLGVELSQFIAAAPMSYLPLLPATAVIPAEWFTELRLALEQLHQTPRSSVSTALVPATARIYSAFGKHLTTPTTETVTIHGDLHWANLTISPLRIFDWEYCGTGPRALDAALLLALSLENHQAADQLHNYFDDWLQTSSGLWAQVYACAMIIELYASQPEFKELIPLVRRHGSLITNTLDRRS
jgi:hypothetical protein